MGTWKGQGWCSGKGSMHGCTSPRYMDRIIREAVEIGLQPNNVNREDGFCLIKSWKRLSCYLKDRRKPPL
jgi:hypothetical protein